MTSRVTCLMLANEPLVRIKDAIACYCDQTVSGRQLVIVSRACHSAAIGRYVDSLVGQDIRIVNVDSTWQESDSIPDRWREGLLDEEPVVAWSAEDFSHPRRLEDQLIEWHDNGGRPMRLPGCLGFDWDARRLYWIRGRNSAPADSVGIPRTLIAKAGIFTELYCNKQQLGDTNGLAGGVLVSQRSQGTGIMRHLDRSAPESRMLVDELLSCHSCTLQDVQQFRDDLICVLKSYRLARPFLMQVLDDARIDWIAYDLWHNQVVK